MLQTCPSKRRKRDDNFDTKEVHWNQPEQVAERMSNYDKFSDSNQRINSDPSDKLKAAVSVSLTVYDSDLWPFSIGKGNCTTILYIMNLAKHKLRVGG